MTVRVLLASHCPLDASGSGIYVRKVAERVEATGGVVATVCPTGSAPDDFSFQHETVGTPSRPSRWNLPFEFPNFSGHRDSHLLYDDLDQADIDTYLEVWTAALTDLVREFRPDVVHVNHAFLLAYAASRLDLPYVVVSHGSEFLRPRPNPAFDVVRREGLLGARELVAITHDIATLMCEASGAPRERVHLVPPGYDPDVFRAGNVDRAEVLESFGLTGTAPCVAYIGRVVVYKRVPDFLTALASIPAADRPQALVVGDGLSLVDAQDTARRLGLTDVVFAGHVADRYQLAQLFRAIDLLVLPSENDPYPMTAIEALASGTPVLTSDRCGVTDIVADVAGAVYPVGDTAAIATGVQAAVRDDWKATHGPHGPARVADKAWPAVVDRLLDVYRRAMR